LIQKAFILNKNFVKKLKNAMLHCMQLSTTVLRLELQRSFCNQTQTPIWNYCIFPSLCSGCGVLQACGSIQSMFGNSFGLTVEFLYLNSKFYVWC